MLPDSWPGHHSCQCFCLNQPQIFPLGEPTVRDEGKEGWKGGWREGQKEGKRVGGREGQREGGRDTEVDT